jgi:hypothetical protein
MRFCETCKAIRVVAQCQICAGPTLTWAQRLTDADRAFLRFAGIAVGDAESPDETSPT